MVRVIGAENVQAKVELIRKEEGGSGECSSISWVYCMLFDGTIHSNYVLDPRKFQYVIDKSQAAS